MLYNLLYALLLQQEVIQIHETMIKMVKEH